MKNILLLFIFLSQPTLANLTCGQEFYSLRSDKVALTQPILKSLYASCDDNDKERFKYILTRSGRYEVEENKVLKEFISNQYGYEQAKKYEIFTEHGSSYDYEEAFKEMDKIIEYAPELIENMLYELSPNEVMRISNKAKYHPNSENNDYIQSLLLAGSLDKSHELQDMLFNNGAHFYDNKVNKDTLCIQIEETIQTRQEYLSDDFYDMGPNEVLEVLNEETDAYMAKISRFVDLNSVICENRTLRDYFNEVKTAEFWYLDDYFGDIQESQDINEGKAQTFKTDDDFIFSNTRIEFKEVVFWAEMKVSKSCKKDEFAMDRLYTMLHNSMLSIKRNYKMKRNAIFATVSTENGCQQGFELSVTTGKARGLDEVVKDIY